MESDGFCLQEECLNPNECSKIDSKELFTKYSNNKEKCILKEFLNIKRKNDINLKDIIGENKFKIKLSNNYNDIVKKSKSENICHNKIIKNKFKININSINLDDIKDESKENINIINEYNKDGDKNKLFLKGDNIVGNIKFKEIKIKIKENEFNIKNNIQIKIEKNVNEKGDDINIKKNIDKIDIKDNNNEKTIEPKLMKKM